MTDASSSQGVLGREISAELGDITLQKISQVAFENASRNLPAIREGANILALRETGLGKGDEALVIAAGPSLYRQDVPAMLREAEYSGTIIATESSMSWCLRHDVVPDLVITLDPHPNRITRWFGDPDLDQAQLEADDYFSRQEQDPSFRKNQLRFNQELVELVNRHGPGMHIAVASCASRAVAARIQDAGMHAYWWNPMFDDPGIPGGLTRRIHHENGLPCLNAGGNVGTACWVFAHAVLGKSRVGLLGVDFGYYADTSYRNTQYYNELVEMVGEERLDEVFVHFTNPHLKKDFYTDPAYLWYRDSFLEMATQADCATINLTGGGILFGEGIEWMTLRDFLDA
jgi:hypothetical protein